MKTLLAVTAAALLMTSGAATAQSASDAQCIILANAFAKDAKEPNAQKTAEAALYFYLGRIGSTMTKTQLKALLEQQSKTLTDDNASATMNKCVQAIQAKIQLLQSLSPPPAKKPEGR